MSVLKSNGSLAQYADDCKAQNDEELLDLPLQCHPTGAGARSRIKAVSSVALRLSDALVQGRSDACRRTGAMPEPRRRLEEGQCATPSPHSWNCLRSASSSMQQCANQQSSLSHPTRLRRRT